jgi:hypothetical protein
MTIVVLAIVFVGAIAGALLAIWKFPVLCLLPAVGFFVPIAFLIGIVERAGPASIVLQILAAIVAPQLSYLAISLFVRFKPWARAVYRVHPVHTPLHATKHGAARGRSQLDGH